MGMTEILKGKVKTVYSTDDPQEVLIQYEDCVTAGNGQMIDYPKGKGTICCLMSAMLFEYLERSSIRTHFIDCPSLDTMKCKKLEIVPVEVICRNIAAGSIVRTTNLKEGMVIQPPIVEFFLKDDTKNDPLLTPDRVRLMGINTQPLIEKTLDINVLLQQLFLMCGVDLVDFKLEFGYDAHGDLYVADELSPDNMRLWSKGKGERFDKDLFRKGEGDIVEAYKTILTKLRQFV
jgi:phosphoribosylaminoimidazole-succinocarboxamide synthase